MMQAHQRSPFPPATEGHSLIPWGQRGCSVFVAAPFASPATAATVSHHLNPHRDGALPAIRTGSAAPVHIGSLNVMGRAGPDSGELAMLSSIAQLFGRALTGLRLGGHSRETNR